MLHVSLRPGQARTTAWLVAIAWLACAWMTPAAQAQQPGGATAQAEALAQAGRHLEAAALYEQQARRGLLTWDADYALLAAREYAAAGEPDEAERVLDKARGRIRTAEQGAMLAGVEARLALGRGDARGALAVLRALPSPLPDSLAPELLELRARAEMTAGQALAGIRTFEQRAAILGTAEARAANDRMLFDSLLLHPPALPLPTAGVSEQERGWLELPALLAEAGTTTAPADMAGARRLQEWSAQHPAHPASVFLPSGATQLRGAVTLAAGPAATIALLVPLSGRQQAAGAAVRDGFAAAWFAAGSARTRPRISVFDTASPGAAAAYQRALAEGAQIVVGPLLKEDVAAIVAAQPSGLPVPTLALNSAFGPGTTSPAFLFQFALDPEQEARAVARRIADDGHTRGIALFPDTAWGQRIRDAFVAEMQAIGSVTLTSAQLYPAAARDFSGPLRAALGQFGGAGDRSEDRSRPAPARNAEFERAAGPQFAFIAATPQAARAIRPQLRFQMTYDLPLYATSDAWEPSVRAAADMDGLVFPEMPWLLYGGQGAPELWDAMQEEWAGRARGRLRLFAFGYDAFRLAQQLGSGSFVAGVDGLTGLLELDRVDGHVKRALQFARIEGGRAQAAGAGVPALDGEAAGNAGSAPPRP